MKRIRINTTTEDLILTGMIVNDRFLREVQDVLDLKLFKSRNSKTIARWCLDYYKEQNKAPGKHIQDIYNTAVEKEDLEEGDAQLIGRLLERISREHERVDNFNIDFVLKRAEEFFDINHTREICETVLDTLDHDPVTAREMMIEFQPKELSTAQGYDVLTDARLIRKSFEENKQPLFKFPGAIGQFINDDLCRGSFIGLMGAEKIGKTWNLMEFAYRSAINRLNTVIVQAGDMTDEQQTRRLAIRIAGRSDKKKFCGKILVPVYDCEYNQKDECDIKQRACKFGLELERDRDKTWYQNLISVVGSRKEKDLFYKDHYDYEPCNYCRRKHSYNYKGSLWYREEHITPLIWRDAIKAMKKIDERMKGRKLKLISYPNDTLTVQEIINQIDRWIERENFIPDVIVVDYADLLTIDSKDDFRHRENSKWKGLRRMSQEYNCLVITATQADAGAYDKESLNLKNFSEDKRKYSHVTSMLALQQLAAEKRAGVMRISKLLTRDDDFDPRQQIKVLQCLPIGAPVLGSYF